MSAAQKKIRAGFWASAAVPLQDTRTAIEVSTTPSIASA